MYASVIVNVASSSVDNFYEYHVTSQMEPLIKVGARVNVSFGNSNRQVMGYVIDLYEEKKNDSTNKDINELLDITPLITPFMLNLALHIKEDTICPLIRILNLMLPSSLIVKSNKYLYVYDKNDLDARLYEYVGSDNTIKLTKELNDLSYVISKEIKNNHIKVMYEANSSINYKFVTKYLVNMTNYGNISCLTDAKQTFIRLYKDSMPLSKNDILFNYDISLYQLDSLIKKDYLTTIKERVSRNTVIDPNMLLIEEPLVNDNYIDTLNKFNDVKLPYLYIPSNNKEKDYIITSLTYKILMNKQMVVIITSDILSSYKYAKLLKNSLSVDVAIINSKISKGEELDYYTDIMNGDYKVVVTTPSGAFFPYQNVGLYFMLDVESDNYFNDQSPRYDLRKVIHYISHYNSSMFILESMSPRVNEYCYGLKKVYNIIDNRVNEVSNINVVNMIDELKEGNTSYISNRLKNALIDNINNNKISLLIVNNKNYSSYVECRECGKVSVCDNCDVSLQYNLKLNKLICPVCAKRFDIITKCSNCFSTSFRYGGVGIENVVEDITNIYPLAKVFSLTTSSIDEYDKLNDQILDNNVDVIVTTETLSKAVTNSKITLACIINLDSTINTPAYDASSRVYSLLTYTYLHLNINGQMIVQTSYPNNSILSSFITGDFNGFIRNEIATRKSLKLEPFVKVNRIIIKGKYDSIYLDANRIKKTLKEATYNKVVVLGPTYSKMFNGCVLIVKHNYENINNIYKKIYEHFQTRDTMVVFDKYPRRL